MQLEKQADSQQAGKWEHRSITKTRQDEYVHSVAHLAIWQTRANSTRTPPHSPAT